MFCGKQLCKNSECGWHSSFGRSCDCDVTLREHPNQLSNTTIIVGRRGNYTAQESWYRVVKELDEAIGADGLRLVAADGSLRYDVVAHANTRFAATRDTLNIQDFTSSSFSSAGLAALHTHDGDDTMQGFNYQNVSLLSSQSITLHDGSQRSQGVLRLTVQGDNTTRSIKGVRRVLVNREQCVDDQGTHNDTCAPPAPPNIVEVDVITRVGSGIASTKVYGPGVFEVLARVPDTDAEDKRGYVFEMVMDHYEATTYDGDSQFVEYQPGNGASSGDNFETGGLSLAPDEDIWGYTMGRCMCLCGGSSSDDVDPLQWYTADDLSGLSAERQQQLLGKQKALLPLKACTVGDVDHTCPAPSSSTPVCPIHDDSLPQSIPASLARHTIRMATPASTPYKPPGKVITQWEQNGDAILEGDEMRRDQAYGWNTLDMESGVADNGLDDKTQWKRQVEARRSSGATFHSGHKAVFHSYKWHWVVPQDKDKSPYIDFFFDGKFLYRQTCFVPTRPGRFMVRVAVRDWSLTGDMTEEVTDNLTAPFTDAHVDIAGIRITPDASSRLVNYPQLWMQCPIAANGVAEMPDVRDLDGNTLSCVSD